MSKRYDRAYFDRWYRASERVVRSDDVRRCVRLALAAAEYVLGRPVRTVLDVGCGEAAWRAPLRRARPEVAYTGFDPSAYAVARFGHRRGIAPAAFGDLAHVCPEERYDLVVCADVLHYLGGAEIRRGLPALTARLGGVAWLQVFAEGDAFDGDLEGWRSRTPAWYRRTFRAAGLAELGLNLWTRAETAQETLTLLEQR